VQGKSALAAAVGRHLWGQGLLPGGALYADLKGVGTQAAALNKIALSMGIKQVHDLHVCMLDAHGQMCSCLLVLHVQRNKLPHPAIMLPAYCSPELDETCTGHI